MKRARTPAAQLGLVVLLATAAPQLASAACLTTPGDITGDGAMTVVDVSCSIAVLLSQIADKFAFEARFLLLYDSRPAGLFKTDTTTIFSIVYTPFKADRG